MAMVDRRGRSGLHDAAPGNDVMAIQRCLAAGDDPNCADRLGFAPLHLAAQQQAVEAAHALLDAGSAVDATNQYGNTLLFVAVFNYRGDGRLAVLLRERGADPHAENSYGQSPVGLARLIANYPVATLFEASTDPSEFWDVSGCGAFGSTILLGIAVWSVLR